MFAYLLGMGSHTQKLINRLSMVKVISLIIVLLLELIVLVNVVLFNLIPVLASPSISSINVGRTSKLTITYADFTSTGSIINLIGLFMIFPAVLTIPFVIEGNSLARIITIIGFICFVLSYLTFILMNIKLGVTCSKFFDLLKDKIGEKRLFSIASKYCGSHSVDCISLLEKTSFYDPIVQSCEKEVYHNVAVEIYVINLTCIFRQLSTLFVNTK